MLNRQNFSQFFGMIFFLVWSPLLIIRYLAYVLIRLYLRKKRTPLSVSHKIKYHIAMQYLGCTHIEPNLVFRSIQNSFCLFSITSKNARALQREKKIYLTFYLFASACYVVVLSGCWSHNVCCTNVFGKKCLLQQSQVNRPVNGK